MSLPGYLVPAKRYGEGLARSSYQAAREEHAFLLRCEGLRYREIGARLGISRAAARTLAQKFGRLTSRSLKRNRSKFRFEET